MTHSFLSSDYDLKPNDLTDVDNLPLTIHRIVETFKFAFAERSSLGDEDFWNVTEVSKIITFFYFIKVDCKFKYLNYFMLHCKKK